MWDRTGILPSRGEISLRALVEDLVDGDRRALARPDPGPSASAPG
jgi:hypothetical protein